MPRGSPLATNSPMGENKDQKNPKSLCTKEPNSHCCHCGYLQTWLLSTPTIFINADLSWQRYKKNTFLSPPQRWNCHTTPNWHPCAHLWMKVFLYLKQFINSRSDCSVKCALINARLQETQKQLYWYWYWYLGTGSSESIRFRWVHWWILSKFKEGIISILYKFFQTKEGKGIDPNSFYESSVTLILKPNTLQKKETID